MYEQRNGLPEAVGVYQSLSGAAVVSANVRNCTMLQQEEPTRVGRADRARERYTVPGWQEPPAPNALRSKGTRRIYIRLPYCTPTTTGLASFPTEVSHCRSAEHPHA